ncbi:MAG: calcitonin gene-related peptide-receptor component protein crcp [Olpidium bornovanus]|uniref:DNA-directed RNA polymerase III subunit RPC9 n=1 Tax=Olpidium bornovanus TaxID=278681 RepID=A0A8H8DGM0_9FUNG|nr:MAG: calcitonin gene-related peptide-receptor component protein crcp [Olpidium bornovanus]
MEVVDARSAMLSNYEVYVVVKEHEDKRKKTATPENPVSTEAKATVEFELLRYLSEGPCRDQTPEDVRALLRGLQGFGLTKAEQLQILNHRPSQMVEIVAQIVEECEERLTTEQSEQLLELITSTLPEPDAMRIIEGPGK